MTVLLLLGGVCLVFATAGLSFWFKNQRDLRAMKRANTVPVQELERRRADNGLNSELREVCEVTGTVQLRRAGPVTSFLSQTECAWYCTRTTEHYVVIINTENGPKRVHRTKIVFEHRSPEWLVVHDSHGDTINADFSSGPEDQPEHLEQVHHRHETYPGGMAPTDLGLQVSEPTHSGTTAGYEYTEWVIRPGQWLYILGEAREVAGSLVIGDPDTKRFLVSPYSEKDLRKHRNHERKWHGGCALLVGVIGITLMTLGFFVA